MAFTFNFLFPEPPILSAGEEFVTATSNTAQPEEKDEASTLTSSTTGSCWDHGDSTEPGRSVDCVGVPLRFQEHHVFADVGKTSSSDAIDSDKAPLLCTLIPEAEWNTFSVGDITLLFVSPDWLDRKLSDLSEAQVVKDGTTASDIIPNVYEGGFRVWDGACDMLSFLVMSEHVDLKGKKVLELGCGAGLPGIYALIQGATVHFHDYNADVIQSATIPNLQQNMLVSNKITRTELASTTRLFSGDWLPFTQHLYVTEKNRANQDIEGDEANRFDVILTSDTVYRKDVLQKLCSVLPLLLRKDGTIYLAGKSHYFGLDGGTDELRAELEKEDKLEVVVAKEYPDCVRREVLTIRWKPGH